ncbi:MAG: hypothetical protein ACI9J3_002146 [Parvicellaceae bacterium]|jgi:hypothetical protein
MKRTFYIVSSFAFIIGIGVFNLQRPNNNGEQIFQKKSDQSKADDKTKTKKKTRKFRKRTTRGISSKNKLHYSNFKNAKHMNVAAKGLRANLASTHTSGASYKKNNNPNHEYFANGSTINISGEDYRLSPVLETESAKNFAPSMGKIIKKIGNIIIFKPNKPVTTKKVSQVAINERTGKIGIVSGKIVLSLKEDKSIQDLIDNYDISLYYNAEQINTYIVQPLDEKQDIFELQNNLNNSELTLWAKAEIVSTVPSVR